ncbi:hypothetical protein LOZ39_003611 [Ophidiomyces ophidiicola]|uniref:Uncharacterized protein n=1 Tax=Ophidiomyces ophidiicola TaxID=1387563 RepID=A0ACB8UUR7_9EURO|nr:hypothetical protein LOZ59_000015 [Ophidiomyces ophidiicola]KAI2027301.1 hypothetical protein LOZ48_004806 [Ophidiomyces ophidiicola]KAI2047841.1 hypothetical protein LOZ38_004675 [Ophidiomyces ophidiicola]KAI2066458.1 hypothetical protein LOZ40_003544 [Ophidiomyces ophidiicola]KAI2074717.1 hypothetical protein LOZ39_003611 [Ophidiomyces ophidiicola]
MSTVSAKIIGHPGEHPGIGVLQNIRMKRKSDVVAEREPSKPNKSKKRKKHRHQSPNDNGHLQPDTVASADCTLSTSKVESGVSRNETIASRLSQLQQLTQEISSSPESIREHIGASSGVEIISAAAELARAFARSGLLPDQFHKAKETAQEIRPLEAPPIKNKALEKAVFTHQGVTKSAPTPPGTHDSYDRLEILGDAYIEIIATRLIWDSFQNLPAGRMSQIRELLVKNETLAQFSEQFGFDKRVNIAPEIRQQPKRWVKVKGDVFEAYVAAVVLSEPINGFDFVENWLTRLWTPILLKVQPEDQASHYKEFLAKKVMGKGIKLRYINESPPISREKGIQTFFIGVYLTGWGWQDQHLGSGTGLNKGAAGNSAAKQALDNHPLIDEIHAAKTSFDEKVKAEREKAGATE